MRKNILETFDKVYILDLHGNSRKLEVSPDGSLDQNVFDIMAGVSINIFIKTGDKKHNQLGKVYHSEIFGKRIIKYPYLIKNTISSIKWQILKNKKPYYFFVPKDFALEDNYKKGYKLDDIFQFNNSGFETAKDKFIIKFQKQSIDKIKSDFTNYPIDELINRYDVKKTKLEEVKNDIDNSKLIQVLYRPFDYRQTLISKNSQGVMFRPRYDTVRHLLKENLGLLCCKRQTSFDFQHTFITKRAVERCSVSLQTGEVSYVFPLYLYSKETNQQSIEAKEERTPNLDLKIVSEIAKKLILTFTNEKEQTKNTFAPIDILDYIYAVLHSPTYREKYKAFFKIDFPRVPYPKDQATFWQLVKLGKEIREIHLLENPKVDEYITTYVGDGDNVITRKLTKTDIGYEPITDTFGKVWINDTQYFNNVPLIAWNFFIGGYQPAQKWLKDRKGRTLDFEDVFHYQKIIVALSETHRIMQEINNIEIE